jgi:hypothetical protein
MSQDPDERDPTASTGEAEAPPELLALPADELRALLERFGLDPADYPTPRHQALAVAQRRALIATLERPVLLELIRWTRRPVPADASEELLAQEVARCRSMRFEGLSPEALRVLALLRGVELRDTDDAERIARRLRKQEGFFARMARKRRRWVGSMVSSMLGETEPEGQTEYQFLPPTGGGPAPPPEASLEDEIEEAGLLGGLAGRIKRSADNYLKVKLDEIEARIDKKLDDIDRRLAEWRDKEVANRLRIIRITLWASVIVAAVSLLYQFIKIYVLPHFQ